MDSIRHSTFRAPSYQHLNRESSSPFFTRTMQVDGAQDSRQQWNFTDSPSFDIIEWHPAYQSCQRFFLDHSQHEPATQALCSLINIRLPFQWLEHPLSTSAVSSPVANASTSFMSTFSRPGNNMTGTSRLQSPNKQSTAPFVSLIPYIRRLVVTGFDSPAILHGFFGDDYGRGILAYVECERRNYLFAAKNGGWGSCKQMYDTGSGGGGDESVPFMKPLEEAKIEEITAAEQAWSSWLAMEDWMLGPRAPSTAQNERRQAGG